MKVPQESKYKLIFSVHKHPQLGVLVHPHVVAYTSKDTLSLTYQKVFSGNASYYTRLSPLELQQVAALDALMVENIIREFSPKQKIRPKEYFHKHFDKELLKTQIRPYIEKAIIKWLSYIPLESKSIYVADNINPAAFRVRIKNDFTKVLFHFRRNENGTSYFITIKHEEERIPYMKLGALLLSQYPARMIVNGSLYKFYDFVDGSKLAVFINKKYVHVKPENERIYYTKFVQPLLETAPVFAQGFTIESKKDNATPLLKITQQEGIYGFKLLLGYGQDTFEYGADKLYHSKLDWEGNEPKFTKYKRSQIWEANRVSALAELNLKNTSRNFFCLENTDLPTALDWLREHKSVLLSGHFQIETTLDFVYSTELPTLNYNISDKIDWFDLNVQITIGQQVIPFAAIVKEMKKGHNRMFLDNGEMFIFPKEWFALGESLINHRSKDNTYSIKKYQLNVLSLIKSKEIKEHLVQLVNIKKEKPHKFFAGKLRPYQIQGLSWLMFIRNNRFGGILADDMGLGKTIQTLAFLQKIKYTNATNAGQFLLIAPTSLLYNWMQEIATFTPELTVALHAGSKRAKIAEDFPKTDILLTSYGLIRNDIALFEEPLFDIIVLDESQNIKNTSAKTTRYISKLQANTRIALTGTPIENTIRDLWSQMNFLNKGLLGSLKQFEEKYAKPIEKKEDRKKAIELQKIIKPFFLRRTKEEVAKDLPPITEKVISCPMTTEQARYYEEVKSKYRNSITDLVQEKGMQKSRFSILQGLSKLRQIANHPYLTNKEYTGSSGKHDLLIQKISDAISDGHKVLVFSQFVSYLDLLERDLKAHIPYYRLTGSTTKEKRAHYVSEFQKTPDPSVFLISLKAGGTGLNLTAADYVFIVDPWWNPAAEAQARDRTHRIGQQQSVFSYKFISKDTIEEKITQLQHKKQGFSKDLILTENNILHNLDISEIRTLLA
ncbi:MAG: DEAD/DEAH box helicase [Bacteroidia bacterium]|jgi:SNF2 family DNA or RNA helicase|nr:DEAD/DEAH box helicase [Bacteroidia bacterium]